MTLVKDGKAGFIQAPCDRGRDPCSGSFAVGDRDWAEL